jgi:hypothetical protein
MSKSRTSTGESATLNGPPVEAPITVPSEPERPLISRIDPADILVDFDADIFADEDDKAPQARWGSPPKDSFVRIHPTWHAKLYLLDCRKTQGLDAEYVLRKDIAKYVMEQELPLGWASVYLVVDRDGGLTLWPIRMGDPADMKDSSNYTRAAMTAVEKAREKWVKIYWRQRRGGNGWRTRAARIEIPEPTFPDDPMAVLTEVIADRFIAARDDKRLRKFLGEE